MLIFDWWKQTNSAGNWVHIKLARIFFSGFLGFAFPLDVLPIEELDDVFPFLQREVLGFVDRDDHIMRSFPIKEDVLIEEVIVGMLAFILLDMEMEMVFLEGGFGIGA